MIEKYHVFNCSWTKGDALTVSLPTEPDKTAVFMEIKTDPVGNDIALNVEDTEKLIDVLESAVQAAKDEQDRENKAEFDRINREALERAYDQKCDEIRDRWREEEDDE